MRMSETQALVLVTMLASAVLGVWLGENAPDALQRRKE
jgi:hypothetical protein